MGRSSAGKAWWAAESAAKKDLLESRGATREEVHLRSWVLKARGRDI